ncbi:MAG: hypothetical protein RLZZ507_4153 [Cyanobacteriota bacterium]|jgi:hypothetical protein
MILANDMMNQPLNVTGLTPEQIEQVQTIIEAFKAKNQLEQSNQPNLEFMSILSGKLGIDFDISLPQKSFKLSPRSSFS